MSNILPSVTVAKLQTILPLHWALTPGRVDRSKGRERRGFLMVWEKGIKKHKKKTPTITIREI